ncbi:phage antirepressor N-terminal domain-containing protein [Acetobacter cerevisiae]|uniref:phage antirepressor N-terminal domain-containing protein n=1 Tax=Acetobacter cerevisiae TaxID=178900 RepID=UPI0007803552|nr:phage antirepressor N-terminal domain-containing protein [Acetobacter cerevisiae]
MSKQLTTVDFHGTKLVAIAGDRPETTLVAMKPIVEGIGLDWGAQHKKMLAHPVLSKGISVTEIPSGGGDQESTCLSLDLLNFWLATIHPDRIKDQAVRARVIEYQTECARVLFNHFFGKAIAAGEHLTAQQTGGIVKAGLGKLKRELLSELKPIETQLAELSSRMDQAMSSYDPSATFTTDYLPALEVLKDHHVLPKGRRALSASCSRMLKRYLIATDRGWMVRISRETERFIFHVDGIRDWLKVEGAAVIKDHKDAVMGQHQLALKDSLVRRAKKATQPPFAKTSA